MYKQSICLFCNADSGQVVASVTAVAACGRDTGQGHRQDGPGKHGHAACPSTAWGRGFLAGAFCQLSRLSTQVCIYKLCVHVCVCVCVVCVMCVW